MRFGRWIFSFSVVSAFYVAFKYVVHAEPNQFLAVYYFPVSARRKMLVVRFRYPRTKPGLDDFTPYLVEKVFLALPFHYILAGLLVPPIYEIRVYMA